MKRKYSLLIIFTVFFISLLLLTNYKVYAVSEGETIIVDNITYEFFEEKNRLCLKIIDCLSTDEHIVIPKYIQGYSVTQIGEYSFEDCTSLKIIEIPTSIARIKNYAFKDCENLESIIGFSDDEIFDLSQRTEYVFEGCHKFVESIYVEKRPHRTCYQIGETPDLITGGTLTLHLWNGNEVEIPFEHKDVEVISNYDFSKQGCYQITVRYKNLEDYYSIFIRDYIIGNTIEEGLLYHQPLNDGIYLNMPLINNLLTNKEKLDSLVQEDNYIYDYIYYRVADDITKATVFYYALDKTKNIDIVIIDEKKYVKCPIGIITKINNEYYPCTTDAPESGTGVECLLGNIVVDNEEFETFEVGGICIPDYVEDIEIKNNPSKEIYEYGEYLDLKGGILQLNMTSGAKQEINLTDEEIEILGYDSNKLGEQEITVLYKNFSTSLFVTVESENVEGIKIKSLPLKTVYQYGENLDLRGGSIEVAISGKERQEIAMHNGCISIEGYNAKILGEQEVTIRYKGFIETFIVKVDGYIPEIEIKNNPTKLVYKYGEELDLIGGILQLNMKNGSQLEIDFTDERVSIEGYSSTILGEQELIVRYEEYATTFTITVEDYVKGIKIKKKPTKTVYKYGEQLDLSGGILQISMESGAKQEIDCSNELVFVEGYEENDVATQVLRVKYKEFITKLEVTVEDYITGIEVKNNPIKTVYEPGEYLEIVGGILQLNMASGEKQEIDFTDEGVFVEGYSPTTLGEQELTVRYGEYTAKYTIKVEIYITNIEIKNNPTKTVYKHGEVLDLTGGILQLNMTNGNQFQIDFTDEGVLVEGYSPTTLGDQELIVKYGEFTTTFTVTVEDYVSEITIKKKPTKNVYKYGEKLDLTGGILQLTMATGEKQEIDLTDGSVYVEGYDSIILGNQELTVRYKGNTTTLIITLEDYITGIEIKKKPTKTVYKYGENLVLTGGILQLRMASGEMQEIDFIDGKVSVEGYNATKLGVTELKVRYEDFTATYLVTVEDYIIGIEIKDKPTKTIYAFGENLELYYGLIKINMASGNHKLISLDDNQVSLSGFDKYKLGRQELTVKYNGFTTILIVQVEEKEISQCNIQKTDGKIYKTEQEILEDIVIKDYNRVLKYGEDYIIKEYRWYVGNIGLILKGIGNYSGETSVSIHMIPKKVNAVKAISVGIDYIKLKWLPVDCWGYEIYKYNEINKNYEMISNVSEEEYYINGLEDGKEYKFKVRAYEYDSMYDKKWYSDYSDIFSISTKPRVNILECDITGINDKEFANKDIKQNIIIEFNNNKLSNGRDYKIQYTNNKNPGKATVTITGIGNYKGTITKTFIIKPKKVSGFKVKEQKTDLIKLSWSKHTGVTGYKVYSYNYSKEKWEYVGKTSSTSYTIKKLKAGTTYKYRVRAYKTVDGTQHFGLYTSSLKTTTKTKIPKISKLTTKSKKVTVKWKKVSGASGYQIYMATSKNGKYSKIKTITKGSTTSYTKTKLKKNKKYYFKTRTYRTVDGKKVYSSYSSVKSIKVK